MDNRTRYLIKMSDGSYVKGLVYGVTPDLTFDLAEAATYASKSYAESKIARFSLTGATVRRVA
jgi:hypothetical protein